MTGHDFPAILGAAHREATRAQAGLPEGSGLDCGFAWVTIDGNEALARFCRAHTTRDTARFYGRKGEPRGWTWWKPGGYSGQSVGIHEAGARAFRDTLARFGIRADVGSRLD